MPNVYSACGGSRRQVERETVSDEEDARLISRIVSRVVLAFMRVGIAIASVLLLGLSGGPRITSTLTVYQLFGYFGLFSSAVLILRVGIAIARERVGRARLKQRLARNCGHVEPVPACACPQRYTAPGKSGSLVLVAVLASRRG